MKILILPTKEKAVERAAGILLAQVRAKPDCILGLATGGTMLDLYRVLVAEVTSTGLNVGQITTFNLDEYVGLAPDHPNSYHAYMAESLFGPLNLAPSQTHLPIGDAPDPDGEAQRYDQLISSLGGIDLQLLGIGQNGHIGFNEPSSSLGSRTRVKTLTRSTRSANEPYFEPGEQVPTLAITMGIGTILDSQECLLLATGGAKAAAVAQMVEGAVSASCPASALQFHARVTVVLDQDAAADLKNKDYYNFVHAEGA